MCRHLLPAFNDLFFNQETPGPAAAPPAATAYTAQAQPTAIAHMGMWPPEMPQAVQQRHIDDLARQLQAARIENDRMRQAIIPPINWQEVTILLNETVPYVWQQSLVSALRVEIEAHPDIDFNNNRLITTVWRTIHQEIRNRRQGRHSAAAVNPT